LRTYHNGASGFHCDIDIKNESMILKKANN